MHADAQLYLIEILHQTTTNEDSFLFCYSCILSKFYIKPQRRRQTGRYICVVSYRNSTSNHNSEFAIRSATPVVSYRNSTSNHNRDRLRAHVRRLYLIEILHQTTTNEDSFLFCYSCILSKFYIKPQLLNFPDSSDCVVSYRNSTSNHNVARNCGVGPCVVSYRNSTSNHNIANSPIAPYLLYLIEILHQTTTAGPEGYDEMRLYLIEILHQTTTPAVVTNNL